MISGWGRFHDQKILALLGGGRINGTSVMVDGGISDKTLRLLRDLREQGALVGLHLNLTHDFGMSLPTIAAWRAYAGKLVRPAAAILRC